jgi:hypothetical protein
MRSSGRARDDSKRERRNDDDAKRDVKGNNSKRATDVSVRACC